MPVAATPAAKTLAETFKELAGTEFNVAGYLETTPDSTTLKYIKSKNSHLPAAAIVLDNVPKKTKVFTNLPADHWLLTYTTEISSVLRIAIHKW
jgi:hypothetical protein